MGESNHHHSHGGDSQDPIQTPVQAMQPDTEFVVIALQEELTQVSNNRIYLLALVRQIGKEYEAAQAQWAAERDSLLSRIAQLQDNTA